jgi:hypothetical protein
MTAFQMVCLVAAIVGIAGAIWINAALPDPYSEIGAGDLALDVSDNVPAPPLHSPAGQAELQQLREAIAAVQAARERSPTTTNRKEAA